TAVEGRHTVPGLAAGWRHEGVEGHGEALDLAPPPVAAHDFTPRPVERPAPPLYLACSSPQTVVTAANYGVGALIFGFGGLDEVRGRPKSSAAAAPLRPGEETVSTAITHP